MESKGRPGMGNTREESALNMFRQMDLKGKSSKDDTVLKTVHQNTITTIRTFEEAGGSVRKFSSESYTSVLFLFTALTRRLASGVDGRIVIWTA